MEAVNHVGLNIGRHTCSWYNNYKDEILFHNRYVMFALFKLYCWYFLTQIVGLPENCIFDPEFTCYSYQFKINYSTGHCKFRIET